MKMAMHGYNSGIWHAVHKFGQPTLCKRRNAVMACEIVNFRDGREQCKRCAAKLAAMDAASAKKTLIKTIDVTPTWEGVLPMLLTSYEDGSATGRGIALDELRRMAKLADAYIAQSKAAAA